MEQLPHQCADMCSCTGRLWSNIFLLLMVTVRLVVTGHQAVQVPLKTLPVIEIVFPAHTAVSCSYWRLLKEKNHINIILPQEKIRSWSKEEIKNWWPSSLILSLCQSVWKRCIFLFSVFLIETLNRENVVLVLGRRQTQHKNPNGESDGSLFLTRPWKQRSCCAAFFLHQFKVFVCLGCQMRSLCLRCGTACSRWRSKTWKSTARRESRSQPKWESSSTSEPTDFVCFHLVLFTSCFSVHTWICFYATVIASFLFLGKSKLKKDYGRMPERTHKDRRIGGQHGG